MRRRSAVVSSEAPLAPASSVPPALPGERHRSLEEMAADLARHEPPPVTISPKPSTMVRPKTENRNAKNLGGGRSLMLNHPGISKASLRYGTAHQSLSQNCARFHEFRQRLVAQAAFEALDALDVIAMLPTPIRQADLMRQFDWPRGRAKHWLEKFAYRWGFMREVAGGYVWEAAEARSA